ncbi:MAG TPA: DUF4261 domain-containing protein [Candidatus Corynebacterium avicola]|uniref:DUF4261 domain-containing protein n=1 Tax=Candidatus Corynebacterium avicola TaxID=2838527 RepID=A0A9D1UM86_9CORY|nr:DUF4261 domain-containing protein [Candidatus Corynebacterium avicola]
MSDENSTTPAAEFTPHLMLGDLLFTEVPTVDDVIAKVTDVPEDVGVTAQAVDGKDGVIEVQIAKFGVTAFLTVIDAPVPNQEAEQNAHQLYCQGDDLERISTHGAQILIAVPPEFTGEPAEQIVDLTARQTQLTVARVHGMVTMALSRLPGLAGYYSGTSAATFGLPFLHQVVSGQFGSTPWPLWVSAWLRPGPEGFSAYTYGLWSMGHPELQVENTRMAPEDLFMFLMDTVAYLILDEGTFEDGQSTGRTAEEVFTLHAEPWIVDEDVPAFRIGM